jgi:ketohexokinase
VNLSHSLYREDHATAASAYIIRSEATGTRTLINHSALPEMSLAEFEGIVDSFRGDETWWHFEVPNPGDGETTPER